MGFGSVMLAKFCQAFIKYHSLEISSFKNDGYELNFLVHAWLGANEFNWGLGIKIILI